MWKPYPAKDASGLSKWVRKAIKPIARRSQANLNSCMQGNTRLLFVSAYPIERPFLEVCPQYPFRWLFKAILPKKKYNVLGEVATGIPQRKIVRMKNQVPAGVDYFQDYQDEVNYLHDPANAHAPGGNACFKLVGDYNQCIKCPSRS